MYWTRVDLGVRVGRGNLGSVAAARVVCSFWEDVSWAWGWFGSWVPWAVEGVEDIVE